MYFSLGIEGDIKHKKWVERSKRSSSSRSDNFLSVSSCMTCKDEITVHKPCIKVECIDA